MHVLRMDNIYVEFFNYCHQLEPGEVIRFTGSVARQSNNISSFRLYLVANYAPLSKVAYRNEELATVNLIAQICRDLFRAANMECRMDDEYSFHFYNARHS